MKHHAIQNDTLEHHRTFLEMMSLLNKFLERDITLLDKIFEIEIKNEQFLEQINDFIKRVRLKIFGSTYLQAQKDYNLFLRMYISKGVGEYSGLEVYFRKYTTALKNMVETKLKINNKTGKNNLDNISMGIIALTDNLLIKLMKHPQTAVELSDEIKNEYDNNSMRFLRALLFFIIVIIISRICIERLKLKNISHLKNLEYITRIYYGQTFSMNQFKILSESNLLGGIVFRGMYFSSTEFRYLAELLEKGFPGKSWTPDWITAANFAKVAEWQTRESIFLASFGEFTAFLKNIKDEGKIAGFSFLIDDPDLALQVIKYIIRISVQEKNENKSRTPLRFLRMNNLIIQFSAGIILSYPLTNEKCLLNLREVSEVEKEIDIDPKFFKLSKYSLDLFLKIGIIPIKK